MKPRWRAVQAALVGWAWLVCLTLPAPAAPVQTLSFSTMPGGAAVYDAANPGTPVATASPGERTSSYTFQVDPAETHQYRLVRPPFDDLTLAVRWNEATAHWQLTEGPRAGKTLPPNGRLDLARTITLNVTPAGARASVAAEAADATQADASVPVGGADQTVDVGGVRIRVVPLPTDAAGRVTVPSAYQPPPIYLTRPGFESSALIFHEGDLDTTFTVLPLQPIALHPIYGPFSYWQFNAVAATLLGGVLAGWTLVLRPRALRQRQAEQRRLDLATAIVAEATAGAEESDLPPMLGRTLSTDLGRAVTIVRKLGAGGMGAVFEGRMESEDGTEKVAVKLLFRSVWKDAEFRQRFQREIQICGRLQHPGIVKLVDHGSFLADGDALPFMVLELVSGSDLRQRIANLPNAPIPVRQAAAWLADILGALRTAHDAGIIHRDLKPENIRITESERVKVMDFGIARVADLDTLTRTGSAMGTPRYMSPEHLNARHVTPAADIYSLGAIAYEMLCGVPPFQDPDMFQLFNKILHDTPVPVAVLRPDVPPALASIIARMLARDLGTRYSCAADVLRDLPAVGRESGR